LRSQRSCKASRYEAGERSGTWQKMRVNGRQEFVIGGYTVGGRTFDALVFGYYEGPRLMYVARTRNGTIIGRYSLPGIEGAHGVVFYRFSRPVFCFEQSFLAETARAAARISFTIRSRL
jgi:hypothetical protein